MEPQSPTRIERREFKFLIAPEVVDRVRELVAVWCELDPFSAALPEHRYTIESLYLDTWDLALYAANVHERLDRFKLRVRRYPDHPGGHVFFEVKRRYHDVILKTRGRVPSDRWRTLLADPWAPLGTLGEAAAVERFVALVHHWRARPVTLVRYQREAWVSLVDEYARVTFDTRICSQPARGVSFDHAPRGWRASDDPELQKTRRSAVVLELKFVNQAPRWMSQLVMRLDLWRRAFSKYGTSLRAWLAPPQSPRERA